MIDLLHIRHQVQDNDCTYTIVQAVANIGRTLLGYGPPIFSDEAPTSFTIKTPTRAVVAALDLTGDEPEVVDESYLNGLELWLDAVLDQVGNEPAQSIVMVQPSSDYLVIHGWDAAGCTAWTDFHLVGNSAIAVGPVHDHPPAPLAPEYGYDISAALIRRSGRHLWGPLWTLNEVGPC